VSLFFFIIASSLLCVNPWEKIMFLDWGGWRAIAVAMCHAITPFDYCTLWCLSCVWRRSLTSSFSFTLFRRIFVSWSCCHLRWFPRRWGKKRNQKLNRLDFLLLRRWESLPTSHWELASSTVVVTVVVTLIPLFLLIIIVVDFNLYPPAHPWTSRKKERFDDVNDYEGKRVWRDWKKKLIETGTESVWLPFPFRFRSLFFIIVFFSSSCCFDFNSTSTFTFSTK
jgi:hypothetical protein